MINGIVWNPAPKRKCKKGKKKMKRNPSASDIWSEHAMLRAQKIDPFAKAKSEKSKKEKSKMAKRKKRKKGKKAKRINKPAVRKTYKRGKKGKKSSRRKSSSVPAVFTVSKGKIHRRKVKKGLILNPFKGFGRSAKMNAVLSKVGEAGAVAVGFVGVGVLSKAIPVGDNTTFTGKMIKIGIKSGIAVATGMALAKFKVKVAPQVVTGMVANIVIDAYDNVIAPKLNLPVTSSFSLPVLPIGTTPSAQNFIKGRSLGTVIRKETVEHPYFN